MFSRFTLQPYALKDESDLKQFETLLEKRPQYELTENEMKFSYIACRILGVPNDVDEYFNELFDYSEAKGIEVLHEQNLNKVMIRKSFVIFKKCSDYIKKHQMV
ncbi:hypothetical tellurium resistance protein [Bacillus thuringiensis serovar israelensis ATCC 35646]|nr:hypothetical tellurium resistance protein [Bacillus thuringiensis serovar israelensis ATCC 35646]